MPVSPRSSSRSTLCWGGAGIVLATLAPAIALTVFLFPAPYEYSWLNSFSLPLPTMLSAVVLVVAFMILARGVRGEHGIAGSSFLGKLALVLYPVAGLAVTMIVLAFGAAPPGTRPETMALAGVGFWAARAFELAALVVAAIAVLRAGVVHGIARWGLPALAITTVATTMLGLVRSEVASELSLWGGLVTVTIQLAVGALFLGPGAARLERIGATVA